MRKMSMNFNYFNFTKNILRNAEISEISSRTSMTFFFSKPQFRVGFILRAHRIRKYARKFFGDWWTNDLPGSSGFFDWFAPTGNRTLALSNQAKTHLTILCHEESLPKLSSQHHGLSSLSTAQFYSVQFYYRDYFLSIIVHSNTPLYNFYKRYRFEIFNHCCNYYFNSLFFFLIMVAIINIH